MTSVMFLLYYLTYKAIITCSFHLTNDIKEKKWNEIKTLFIALNLSTCCNDWTNWGDKNDGKFVLKMFINCSNLMHVEVH